MADKKFTKSQLEEKCDIYKEKIDDWMLYDLSFQSGKPLIKYALQQNPRESTRNYKNRIWVGYSFNYAKSIIEILNFYLTEKEVVRDLDPLADDPIWTRFKKDCDLTGTNYDDFLDEAQKLASVFGSIGILVNKPGGATTLGRALNDNVYPYYCMYSLPNIYDWKWEQDPVTHRRQLSYLKLLESDGTYTLWWKDKWEQWAIDDRTKKLTLLHEGINPLDEIPFVWMNNLKDYRTPEIGVSDIIDISHIVLSIIQNLSCGEEMINLAGFPIRRQPMRKEGDEGDSEVQTGPRAVEEFDPTLGKEGKPDWMPTEILEPVEATLKWIDRKTDEIFRVAHLSGVHGQRKSNNEVASGMALRYEFQQLNTVLVKKSINQVEAELSCLRLWMKWQGKEGEFEKCDVKRSTDFSIDDVAVALENVLLSINRVMSKTYRIRMQEKILKYMLPDLSEDDVRKIKTEIQYGTPVEIEWPADMKNTNEEVRTAPQATADHSKDE